jgi:hypothetical protein
VGVGVGVGVGGEWYLLREQERGGEEEREGERRRGEERRRMLTATSDGTGKLWSIPPSSTSFTFGCLSRGTDTPPVVVFGLAPVIAVLFLARPQAPRPAGQKIQSFPSDLGKGIRCNGSMIPRDPRALFS